jgi:hypothetical protein
MIFVDGEEEETSPAEIDGVPIDDLRDDVEPREVRRDSWTTIASLARS